MKQTKRVLTAILPLAVTLFFVAGEAQAYVTSDGLCTPGNVTLTSITTSTKNSADRDTVFDGSALDATSCFGVVKGNDSGNGQAKGRNTGELNDGLLNGGAKKAGEGIDPSTFFLTDADQYLDLKGNGNATDPGWIYLGKFEGREFEGWRVKVADPDTRKTQELQISEVLSFSLTATDKGSAGDWKLATNWDIIDTVIEKGVLTDRSLFDHLALILKAGNGYVVYDFNFNILQEALGDGFNYTTPYILSGTWDTRDLGGKELSHLLNFRKVMSDKQVLADIATFRLAEEGSNQRGQLLDPAQGSQGEALHVRRALY